MDPDPPGTFDYIYVKGDIFQLTDISIFGNKPLPTDSTIYPSDHMGLKLNFNIKWITIFIFFHW